MANLLTISGRTLSQIRDDVSSLVRAQQQAQNGIKEVLTPIYDLTALKLNQIEILSKKVFFRLKVNGIKYKIINERTGATGTDIMRMYQNINNYIILDVRHLHKSIYNGKYNGVDFTKTNNAIKAHLVENFYYNMDFKEYSFTKLYAKNCYNQWQLEKELNYNYTYKCIDFYKRNKKEFCPRAIINTTCSEKEQDKIIKSLDSILDYHMKHNKISFKINFINSTKTHYKKFVEETKVKNKTKYPQYNNDLLYRFFGIEYKNFGSMKMHSIGYFILKPYLAMPEALGVDNLELVLEMLHHKGVYTFDELINRTIEEKQQTIGFREEIENDEEDLY